MSSKTHVAMRSLSAAIAMLAATIMATFAADDMMLPFKSLLVGGWGFNHVAMVDPAASETWSIDGNAVKVCDVWPLDEQTILHVTGKSVRAVRRDASGRGPGEVLWEWAAPKGTELHGCQPLPEDRILIAINSKETLDLIELDATTRKELSRATVTDKTLVRGAHTTARSVRKTIRGTYLVGCMGSSAGGAEISADGELLLRFPGARYGVFERPGGGYIAGGGDERCVIAFDADGNEEWRIQSEDIPGFTLLFVAQVHEFEDGRLLVANWGGHHRKLMGDDTPCVGLISADRKRLEWSAALEPRNRAAAFCVIHEDEKGLKK